MAMDAEQFREWLLIYGADLQRWPEDIRQAGLEALDQSLACRSLQEDHAQFETMLRSRGHEEPSPDLAVRIIVAARRRERRAYSGLVELLASCFADLRLPTPVVTAAAVLIVGFVIGLWLPSATIPVDSDSTEVQTFLDSATEAL
jgi:hypothetical protein